MVVNAFLRVADRWPLLRLVVAGGGSLTPHLRALAENSRVADRVLFLCEVTHDRLRDAYRGADLYVSASSVDGTSVSLLEAMACGAGVCVSAIPGNAQWVTPSTGFTFPVGDVDALAQHLADLGRADLALDTDRALQLCAASDLVRERADWSRAPGVLREAAVMAITRNERCRRL